MPLYTFLNELTGEYKDILMSMQDSHEYTDDTGYKWTRIFYSPQASIDTKFDPWDSKDFVNKSRNKAGTLGQIMDTSAELSQKRADTEGVDPLKEKKYSDYKERVGKDHIHVLKQKAADRLKKMDVVIE